MSARLRPCGTVARARRAARARRDRAADRGRISPPPRFAEAGRPPGPPAGDGGLAAACRTCPAATTTAPMPPSAYVEQPEQELPGVPRMFATAVTLEGYRPAGARYDLFRPADQARRQSGAPGERRRQRRLMQAAVLGLYDPDRSQAPSLRGRPATWAEAGAALAKLREGWMADRGASLRILTGATTSPTLARQFRRTARGTARGAHPCVRTGGHPMPNTPASALAFGRPLDVRRHFEQARVIVALDDDFLGPGPRQVIQRAAGPPPVPRRRARVSTSRNRPRA